MNKDLYLKVSLYELLFERTTKNVDSIKLQKRKNAYRALAHNLEGVNINKDDTSKLFEDLKKYLIIFTEIFIDMPKLKSTSIVLARVREEIHMAKDLNSIDEIIEKLLEYSRTIIE